MTLDRDYLNNSNTDKTQYLAVAEAYDILDVLYAVPGTGDRLADIEIEGLFFGEP